MTKYITNYSTQITKELITGTERSLYKPLGNFLEKFINEKFKEQIICSSEQSSTNYDTGVGFPDITIKNNDDFEIGWIEVKLPKDNLDNEKFKEQFTRYKNSLENVIFTNLNVWEMWQWDKDNKPKKIKEVVFNYEDTGNIVEFEKFINLFIAYKPTQAKTSKQLAIALARKTKLLSATIEGLANEGKYEHVLNMKKAFESTLLHDLDNHTFANLVAETFTYSLFIAAIYHYEEDVNAPFTLNTALEYIPETIPVLNDLYRLTQNASNKIEDIKRIVTVILNQINHADLVKIVASFYRDSAQTDPVLYFYETFLQEYDRETKKKRGAYYTPKPVVDFIVKSVDNILMNEFGKVDGLADTHVKVLDPATGTGTFLASGIELIKDRIDKKYKAIGIDKEKFEIEVSQHILKNFYGFEFMLAPYTVAHLKLTLLLKKMGFSFDATKDDNDSDNDRFKIYLANTLDSPDKEPNNLPGLESITEESKKARDVKKNQDIIAIMGNPPYSGSSQNPSKLKNKLTWIGEQIETYKYDGTKKLDEKNPKWLQNDYVKFMRFAQYKIDALGYGVIGYIVDNGFLDNQTFRYMRKSLLDSFSKIYIIDLHGNQKKKETTSTGARDENIFNIEQGVCIILMIKEKDKNESQVYHTEIFGTREEKFAFLETNNLNTLSFSMLHPKSDSYYLMPKNEDVNYDKFWSVKEIFQVNNVGIVTANDKLYINSNKNELIQNLNKENITVDENKIHNISYRPFDKRVIYYDTKLLERARHDVMQHLLHKNIGLLTCRQLSSDIWQHVLLSTQITDDSVISNKTKERSYMFPLYRYTQKNHINLFGEEEKEVNFTEKFKEYWQKELKDYNEEDIFYYIYGLLHSPSYRERYNEFLKTDFPRVDFSYGIKAIANCGRELASLHLLTHPIFSDTSKWGISKQGSGDMIVSFARKADIYKDGKIYLNPTTYIEGVEKEVFEFMIGGYQVLDKYLSDRKGQVLDLEHYMKIIVSLRETMRIMREIDEIAIVEGR